MDLNVSIWPLSVENALMIVVPGQDERKNHEDWASICVNLITVKEKQSHYNFSYNIII